MIVVHTKEVTMPLQGAAITDVGKVRRSNEDSYGFFPGAAFYVVADGMGGHVGGEIASTVAVETMYTSLQATQDQDLTPVFDVSGQTSVGGRRLLIALEQANNKVLAMGRQDTSLKGMGTTIAAILFEEGTQQASICHVGDSRVYRIRQGHIEQLTEDHSLAQHLVRAGNLDPAAMERSPHRHVLMQAVGIRPTVQPDLRIEKPEPEDVFVVCSDGVHGVVTNEEIKEVVDSPSFDPQRACQTLVTLANARGGPDNCTIIILRYERGDER
jgi:protein phosphatase